MLQSPVAEGNQDIVELQALTLVYGENTYAVGFAALDGFAADGFFPFIDKRHVPLLFHTHRPGLLPNFILLTWALTYFLWEV